MLSADSAVERKLREYLRVLEAGDEKTQQVGSSSASSAR